MEENNIILFEELAELLHSRQYSPFMHRLDELPPMDAADFFATLTEEELPLAFRLLKKDTAAEIFAELDPELQQLIIEKMSDRELGRMLEELFLDDAVDMLEEMPAKVVKRILANVTPETREDINRILSYPEDSAGSVMTAEFLDLHRSMTCAQAIERIRRIGLDKETVYVAYVISESRVLEGVIQLKQLLFASPDTLVGDMMESVPSATTQEDRETVADLIARYDLLALPIVDSENRLVGIVTIDDALDVIETEATEDMEIMAAMTPTDKPYLKTGVFSTWKKRFPWLLILMLSATLTGTVITHYESAIGTYAILTAFFPMLMGTGGNAGGQTSVAVIRSLSLHELSPKDSFRVLWKELRVGLLSGATLAAAAFIKTFLIDFKAAVETVTISGQPQNNLILSLIIALTVLFGVLVAELTGALLPLGAKRIGLDPAVMAGPFITTIVDTVTLVIYFAVASQFLPI